MHPDRIAANKACAAAMDRIRAARTDEEAEAAFEAHKAAVRHSCAVDAKHPTAREARLARERVRLNNRGFRD